MQELESDQPVHYCRPGKKIKLPISNRSFCYLANMAIYQGDERCEVMEMIAVSRDSICNSVNPIFNNGR